MFCLSSGLSQNFFASSEKTFKGSLIVNRTNDFVVVGLVFAVEQRGSGSFTEEKNSKRSNDLFVGIASGWSSASL